MLGLVGNVGHFNMGDDTSVVLNHFQEQARKTIKNGDGDSSLALFEWSAPEGCALDDRSAWVQAIPALGYTIDEETIRSDQLSDPEEVFRTEVLCQRVPTLGAVAYHVGYVAYSDR